MADGIMRSSPEQAAKSEASRSIPWETPERGFRKFRIQMRFYQSIYNYFFVICPATGDGVLP